MALRGYYRSPRSEETYIDSFLDIRDASGRVVPGYGWIFPLGDGRVNVGVGLLSTQGRGKHVNTTKLMDDFLAQVPASWCLDPRTACGAPVGGRLPMGLGVGPRVGPDAVVVGDAAGVINPFNGEGIAYGYETGRLAAGAVADTLAAGEPGLLAGYEQSLQDIYGLYYRVARAFIGVLSRPGLMRICVNAGMYNRPVMEWLLRIMGNYLRPDELGPAEVVYRALVALARPCPRELAAHPPRHLAGGLGGRLERAGDVLVGVGQRHEGDLVRARRERDATSEHGPEERGEEPRPGRTGRALVIAYRLVGKEDREQGAKDRHLHGEPALADGPGEPVPEAGNVLRQERVRLLVQALEHGQARGGGQRVARQGARLVHGPGRGQ